MAAVRARTRCRTRTITPLGVRPPCCSRSSWPLKVSFVDGFDDLAQRLEIPGAGRCGLALAGRAQQRDPRRGDGGLEVAAVVVLVADQRLAGPGGQQARVGGEHADEHLALVGLSAGQGERDGQALQGADQVQVAPGNTASGWRSTRTAPTRPGQGASRSRGTGRTPPGWSRQPRRHRSTRRRWRPGRDAVPDQRGGRGQPPARLDRRVRDRRARRAGAPPPARRVGAQRPGVRRRPPTRGSGGGHRGRPLRRPAPSAPGADAGRAAPPPGPGRGPPGT
jgi:hypothetical protein